MFGKCKGRVNLGRMGLRRMGLHMDYMDIVVDGVVDLGVAEEHKVDWRYGVLEGVAVEYGVG